MKCLVVTTKPWDINNYTALKENHPEHDWHLCDTRQALTLETLEKINPDFLFISHWSWMIPAEIWSRFTCIVFHMTDLPYGRGGSPLQNLIARGHTTTKISALRVTGEVDAGDIYLKKPLSLRGSAEAIYKRASKSIYTKMIPELLEKKKLPKKQKGTPVVFTRRTPDQSELKFGARLQEIYNHIRMLDAPGYPPAYLKLDGKIVTFKKATLKGDRLIAQVEVKLNHENI